MKAGGLTSLSSFTSTIRRKTWTASKAWLDGTELLLEESPVEVFQCYLPVSDSDLKGAQPDTFCIRIVNQHWDRLTRFSFRRPCISLGTIEQVCISCPRLEELFMAVQYIEMVCLLFFL
jgi:hypothetical protein